MAGWVSGLLPSCPRGPSPLDGDPGCSPVGVHHLLQLVVEDKLRVPGERVLSQQAHPDSRATGGPTSLGTWRRKGAPQVCACTRLPLSLLGKDRALFSTNVFPVAFWGILSKTKCGYCGNYLVWEVFL